MKRRADRTRRNTAALVLAAVAVAVLTFAAPAAFADSTHTCQGNSCNGDSGSASASAASVATSSAVANSTSVSGASAVGVGGNASATAKGGNASADSVNINAPVQKYEGSYTGSQSVSVKTEVPRQAPAVVAPALSVSSLTCMASVSVGASTPFGGASVGVPKLDKGCEKRANAMILHTLGQSQAALRLMAQDDAVRLALEQAGVSFASVPVDPRAVELATELATRTAHPAQIFGQ